MGRVDHKIAKLVNAARHSPGVEFLQPGAWTGKNGLALDEYAPFGVIGKHHPEYAPRADMINNIIIQLAGGNTIAFNPHPSAKKVNAKVIRLANQYMVEAGAPRNLVTCVAEPTLESAKALFGHRYVKLLSVTGGPQVVDLAMTYPKKVIAAGPGNPPVLVDETADLMLAAAEITMSASYDNNVLCYRGEGDLRRRLRVRGVHARDGKGREPPADDGADGRAGQDRAQLSGKALADQPRLRRESAPQVLGPCDRTERLRRRPAPVR